MREDSVRPGHLIGASGQSLSFSVSRMRLALRIGVVLGALLLGAFLGSYLTWRHTRPTIALFDATFALQDQQYVATERSHGTSAEYEQALRNYSAYLHGHKCRDVPLMPDQYCVLELARTYARLSALAADHGDPPGAERYMASATALCPRTGWQNCSGELIAAHVARLDANTPWASAMEANVKHAANNRVWTPPSSTDH